MGKSEQGLQPERYQVIPRTLSFITYQDKVLLIKGAPDKKIWANYYNGIGGHIERGEDVLSSAKREIFEESGLKPDDLLLCGTVLIDVEEHLGIGLYVFKTQSATEDVFASKEGRLEWVSIDELSSYDLVEDLETILPIVLGFQRGQAPFHARYSYDQNEKLVIRFGD